MQRKGLTAPPEEGEARQTRGMMSPDPATGAAPLSVQALLWSVAGVLAVVELMLKTLLG